MFNSFEAALISKALTIRPDLTVDDVFSVISNEADNSGKVIFDTEEPRASRIVSVNL